MTSGQSGRRVTTTPLMYCPRMQFTSCPLAAASNLAATVSKAVDEVIGGWEVSPILSCRTGWPMPAWWARTTPVPSVVAPGQTATPCRRSKILQRYRWRRGWPQWFINNGNFAQPAAGTFGNCAPQLAGLRTPRYTDLDSACTRISRSQNGSGCSSAPTSSTPSIILNTTLRTWVMGQTMGQITSAQPPSNIQVALKLYY